MLDKLKFDISGDDFREESYSNYFCARLLNHNLRVQTKVKLGKQKLFLQ
jgi:hypothetical protein